MLTVIWDSNFIHFCSHTTYYEVIIFPLLIIDTFKFKVEFIESVVTTREDRKWSQSCTDFFKTVKFKFNDKFKSLNTNGKNKNGTVAYFLNVNGLEILLD